MVFLIDRWKKQAAIHPPLPPIQHPWGTTLPLYVSLSPAQREVWGISANPELGVCRLQTFSSLLHPSTPGELTGPSPPRCFSARIQSPGVIAQPSPAKSPLPDARIPLCCLFPCSLRGDGRAAFDTGTCWGSWPAAYLLQPTLSGF